MHLSIGSIFSLISLAHLVPAKGQVYGDCSMPPFICQAIPKSELAWASPEWRIVGSYHDIIYAYGRAMEILKILKSDGSQSASNHSEVELTHPNVTTWKRWIKFHQDRKSTNSQKADSQPAKDLDNSKAYSVWVVIVPRNDYKPLLISGDDESFPKLITLIMLKSNDRTENKFEDLDVRLAKRKQNGRRMEAFDEESSKGSQNIQKIDGNFLSQIVSPIQVPDDDSDHSDQERAPSNLESESSESNHKRQIGWENPSLKEKGFGQENLYIDGTNQDEVVRQFSGDGDSAHAKRSSILNLGLDRFGLFKHYFDYKSTPNAQKLELEQDSEDDYMSVLDNMQAETGLNSDEVVMSALDELKAEENQSDDIDKSALHESQVEKDNHYDKPDQSAFAEAEVIQNEPQVEVDEEFDDDFLSAFAQPFLNKDPLNYQPIDNSLLKSNDENLRINPTEIAKILNPYLHLLGAGPKEDEYVEKFIKTLQVDKKKQEEIEMATKNQSYCEQWHKERRYRLTASCFGIVYSWTDTYTRLIYRLLYCFTQRNAGKQSALDWGKDHERVAAVEYGLLHNVTVEPAGLIIDLKRGFLAASPDGYIGNDTLCEIKCPYFLREKDPIEVAKEDTGLYCCDYDPLKDKITLKRDHYYHYQLQGQMAISGRKKGVFILWCPEGIISENIDFDPELWEKMVAKLEKFYKKWLVPELLYNYHRFDMHKDDRT